MGQIPDIDKKPKYNKTDAFTWVDMQWEKFMTEQKELKAHIQQLQDDLVTCNKHFQRQRRRYLKTKKQLRDLLERNENNG